MTLLPDPLVIFPAALRKVWANCAASRFPSCKLLKAAFERASMTSCTCSSTSTSGFSKNRLIRACCAHALTVAGANSCRAHSSLNVWGHPSGSLERINVQTTTSASTQAL